MLNSVCYYILDVFSKFCTSNLNIQILTRKDKFETICIYKYENGEAAMIIAL